MDGIQQVPDIQSDPDTQVDLGTQVDPGIQLDPNIQVDPGIQADTPTATQTTITQTNSTQIIGFPKYLVSSQLARHILLEEDLTALEQTAIKEDIHNIQQDTQVGIPLIQLTIQVLLLIRLLLYIRQGEMVDTADIMEMEDN